MSSSSKSPRDYSRKYQRAILEPWRLSHGLPSSPPSPPPTRTSPTSPISNDSLSYSSPLQNSTQNLNEIHHLSNLLDINLQQANKATNPSPPTLPYIPPPYLEQGIKNFENKLNINGKISDGLGTCQPRVSVKGQILTDFIVERPEEDSPDTLMEVEEELPEPWILFDATKNKAEYEALIAGLRIAEQMGVKNLQANVTALTSSFKAFSIRQVPRSENKKADALSKIASTSFTHLSKQVLVKQLKEKSISEVEILAVVEEEGDTWMTPIFEYLTKETLSANAKKARAVRRKSQRFVVLNGTLYKNLSSDHGYGA
ncbi:reverse transcriptase domain-containing protein [Tanacetum coccineum]